MKDYNVPLYFREYKETGFKAGQPELERIRMLDHRTEEARGGKASESAATLYGITAGVTSYSIA